MGEVEFVDGLKEGKCAARDGRPRAGLLPVGDFLGDEAAGLR
jgi:hypothetical protein